MHSGKDLRTEAVGKRRAFKIRIFSGTQNIQNKSYRFYVPQITRVSDVSQSAAPLMFCSKETKTRSQQNTKSGCKIIGYQKFSELIRFFVLWFLTILGWFTKVQDVKFFQKNENYQHRNKTGIKTDILAGACFPKSTSS